MVQKQEGRKKVKMYMNATDVCILRNLTSSCLCSLTIEIFMEYHMFVCECDCMCLGEGVGEVVVVYKWQCKCYFEDFISCHNSYLEMRVVDHDLNSA